MVYFCLLPVWFPCFQSIVSCQSQPREANTQNQSKTLLPVLLSAEALKLKVDFTQQKKEKINISQQGEHIKVFSTNGRWWNFAQSQSAVVRATHLQHNTSLCSRGLNSAGCQMDVFWLYSYIKATLLSICVTLWLNCHPTATTSLFVKRFLNFCFQSVASCLKLMWISV